LIREVVVEMGGSYFCNTLIFSFALYL